MQKLWKITLLALAFSVLSSCNAPLVRNTLSLPADIVRGTARTVGLGGVGGL